MVQIFVRNLEGRSIAYDLEGEWCSISSLHELVQETERIPVNDVSLVFSGRQLQEQSCLSAYGITAGSTINLVLRLRGGKGGFGALLRGQGRDGKVTSNFDAMRDLQGRRIRHSKCDEKLEEWRGKAHERELENIALKHIKEVTKEERRKAKYEVNTEEVAEKQSETIRKVQDAVQEALAASSAADISAKRKTDAAAEKPVAKKSKILACLEEIEDSEDDST
ncbi:hypothetical protein CEUSTIGMA_g13047.t1 [Chlamydomonas eustigma]|uniref:Ubiquitin-like domain-containing protein n=1 Tax=Chlamydomonas eustigma TaxID=1157962 RepID=A0A250XRS3_9CHLO|nr:hypothetical protein CEUSTIGMA_g13047.t1 [Chlamydomonas eustigma]|eukprot:GAX85632.1 hypothetical protein CEUSTIGMA_g13047.t1 [Chlamydomonas eustigma]